MSRFENRAHFAHFPKIVFSCSYLFNFNSYARASDLEQTFFNHYWILINFMPHPLLVWAWRTRSLITFEIGHFLCLTFSVQKVYISSQKPNAFVVFVPWQLKKCQKFTFCFKWAIFSNLLTNNGTSRWSSPSYFPSTPDSASYQKIDTHTHTRVTIYSSGQ